MAELWVKYKGRESIVEVFDLDGKKLVRELWPEREPREHACRWDDAGCEVLDREVFWTAERRA